MTHKKKSLLIGSVIAVILLLVAIICVNKFFTGNQKVSQGVSGKIESGWDANVNTQQGSQSSGTQIPGYSVAEMKAGDKTLHLSIGNPKDNKCAFYATLKLDDGTVLYESSKIEPGSGITEVPLLQTLKKGQYNAMVEYRCVTNDENETQLNSAVSEFKLNVN